MSLKANHDDFSRFHRTCLTGQRPYAIPGVDTFSWYRAREAIAIDISNAECVAVIDNVDSISCKMSDVH